MIFTEMTLAPEPNRLVVLVDAGLDTGALADAALYLARQRMPKVSGATAQSLYPVSGTGMFGVGWSGKTAWFIERGINPFTMNALAGKLIPMWIDDPTGKERRDNPKAKVRRTKDGRTQVLIFRRAGTKGGRKLVYRRGRDGVLHPAMAPTSYPGAPGRISRREAAAPLTAEGKVGGQIRKGNVGVRWRHPGTTSRNLINASIADTCLHNGITPTTVYAVDDTALYQLIRS